MTTSLCTSSHTIQSTQATHELALWRSTALPGWVIRRVPINIHSTPLPSMNGRLWAAEHQPPAQHKMSRAKNSGKHFHISTVFLILLDFFAFYFFYLIFYSFTFFYLCNFLLFKFYFFKKYVLFFHFFFTFLFLIFLFLYFFFFSFFSLSKKNSYFQFFMFFFFCLFFVFHFFLSKNIFFHFLFFSLLQGVPSK